MNRHERIECKGCGKRSLTFRCYRCLSCQDFDICEECYDNDFTTSTHPFDHPVVCVLIPADVELYFGGEYISNYPPQSYRCPYCKRWGFNESTFLEHVSAMHPDASPLLVSTMVGLFEQQQAARLFLENEQLASIAVAATSRNELMRRPEGSMALYLEPLNRDGSYRRVVERNNEDRSRRLSPDGRDRLQALVRERYSRIARRSAARVGNMTSRPLLAPAPGDGSRLSGIQESIEAGQGIRNVIVEELSTSNYDPPFTINASASAILEQQQQQQQVMGPSPNAAAPPIVTHPSLIEMMRFYDEAGLQPFPASSRRVIRTRHANPAPPAANIGNNTRSINVYGPTSAFTQASHNTRSLTAPDLFSLDERYRISRMPMFQANPGALHRQGTGTRALDTRAVEFSEFPPEETELPLILGTSTIEDPSKLTKQRDQERRRFLCYRFTTPRSSKRPQNHFLLQRAEFVSQVLYSALCDEDFQDISFPILRNIPKLRTIPDNVISGAGDAEKNPSNP